MTNIQWTDETWNPIRGCSRVSEGCRNCYAETMAGRFCGPGEPYEGLITIGPKGRRWNGTTKFVTEKLDQPLRWTKPRMVFVNSMSDLFHESLSNEQIDAIFAVMQASPAHTFQVLTKRPKRMLEWFEGASLRVSDAGEALAAQNRWCHAHENADWPLANVWIGVSVEDQKSAVERIPWLADVPAAVRWISLEPQLGAVDLTDLELVAEDPPNGPRVSMNALTGHVRGPDDMLPALNWVVIGGESGPGARPFDLAWARKTISQCREAKVPVFLKQFGNRAADSEFKAGVYAPADPRTKRIESELGCTAHLVLTNDRKGGQITEWPKDLRIREWPET